MRPLIATVAAASLAGCAHAAPAPSPAPAAAPGAAAAPASAATPCFPDAPALAAADVYQQLERFAWAAYDNPDEPAPTGTFGTCRVERNVVRDAAGAVVAELGCGVRILQPGITDGLGLQLGARGDEVMARTSRAVDSLVCVANGPDRVRCSFARRDDEDTDPDWYVVAGQLDDDVVTGAAARAFFGPRALVELDVSVWCH
ncbi:MAG: hypothetical protein H6708_19185 [Kofleriaceae bacterium]|nr:hypothetical protein [Kofleriaceae bacterium]